MQVTTHKRPWIKLHTLLLRWSTTTALPSDQGTKKAVSAQPQLRPLLSQGSWREGRSASGKPGSFLAAPKFLSGAFCFHESHWDKAWTRRTGSMLMGASLSQTHCIDFSTKHNCKWTASTSEKALQLVDLAETGGSAAFSQQPSKQPVPRLWLQLWQRKRFTSTCGYISFFTPSAEGTLKPTLNKQHWLQGLWSDREIFKGRVLLELFSGHSVHWFATQDCSG